MLDLILVPYDNLVMCFTLYLHYSKRDFMGGIFYIISFYIIAERSTIY